MHPVRAVTVSCSPRRSARTSRQKLPKLLMGGIPIRNASSGGKGGSSTKEGIKPGTCSEVLSHYIRHRTLNEVTRSPQTQ